MRWLAVVTFALGLSSVAANAATLEQLRSNVLRGDYDTATWPALDESASTVEAVTAQYYSGLSSFALKDYTGAVGLLAQVAEQASDRPLGLKAAVIATLALARNGDREETCQYAAVVGPLAQSLSPIWRTWVEEAQRSVGCE